MDDLFGGPPQQAESTADPKLKAAIERGMVYRVALERLVKHLRFHRRKGIWTDAELQASLALKRAEKLLNQAGIEILE